MCNVQIFVCAQIHNFKRPGSDLEGTCQSLIQSNLGYRPPWPGDHLAIRDASLTTGGGGLQNWAKFTRYFLRRGLTIQLPWYKDQIRWLICQNRDVFTSRFWKINNPANLVITQCFRRKKWASVASVHVIPSTQICTLTCNDLFRNLCEYSKSKNPRITRPALIKGMNQTMVWRDMTLL